MQNSLDMRFASRSFVIGGLLSLAASSIQAVGFGRTETATVLGQPLRFSVTLRHDADEFVSTECINADVRVGDHRLTPSQVRATIDGDGNTRERVLRVTTTALIDEPIVSVIVGVGCPVHMSREFVVFVDPPVVRHAQAGGADAAPATPAPSRASAPRATSAQAGSAARDASRSDVQQGQSRPRAAARSAPRAGRQAPSTGEGTVTAQPSSRPSAPTQQAAQSTPRRSSGPRLQLESAATLPAQAAASAAEAEQQAAAALAAAASAAEAASQAAAREAARVQALEESLAKVREEAAATQRTLAALQARLAEAESARRPNTLVYVLGGLCAFLALLLGALLWRRSRERDARWWADQAASRADAGAVSRAPAMDSQREPAPRTQPPAVHEAEDSRYPLIARPTISPETQPAFAEPKRPVSVEELIDLEQQAEFFVVLGQDDAAVDLLMNHLRSTGGISPLPYLKLLEIYRRRGQREPYERIRERFNRRFNAYAPEWEADASAGRSLEDYPEVMARIEALWPTPKRAMDELEALLFRRDEGETFDVPAYSEVLLLYSLARDKLERPEEQLQDVDLLLPIGDDDVTASSLPVRPSAPLAIPPVRSSRTTPDDPMTLDFDVSGETEAERESRRQRYEEGEFSFGTDWGNNLKRPRK